MGVVLIKEDLAFMSRGYSYCSATLYIYCDRCGSFNIRSYISAEKWVLIACVIAWIGGSAFVVYQPWGRAYWYLLLLCVIVSIAAFKYLWGDTGYACRQCGQNPTT